MKVKIFENGFLKQNCYLIYYNNNALIIDPGQKIKELDNFIKDNNLKIIGILITHYHNDHTGALKYYKELYNVEVTDFNSSKYMEIGEFKFKIIECFGHTMDSVSFYFEKDNTMFTGDFLFKETIGNYQPKNEGEMYNSLTNILQYPPKTKIYPGHDETSTLEYEIKHNKYFRGLL